MTVLKHNHETLHHRYGFSLIEASLSVILVGVMLVAAINTLGATKTSQTRIEDRVHGPQLAQSLMEEILTQAYEEPEESVTPVFGPEPGEDAGTRINFDDVDDYHGLSESNIADQDGNTPSGLSGWTRHVSVSWTNTTNLNGGQPSETGLKRIIVTVKYNDRIVTTIQALRSDWAYAQ